HRRLRQPLGVYSGEHSDGNGRVVFNLVGAYLNTPFQISPEFTQTKRAHRNALLPIRTRSRKGDSSVALRVNSFGVGEKVLIGIPRIPRSGDRWAWLDTRPRWVA
ncbi:hypothetical protein, partial [Candidatus Chlorohelix sp.]|uniref:hypothetical protein n=1 Tax=Candidatus Chlorohelix sp. TaxID=3139201 RepID=UPI00303F6B49